MSADSLATWIQIVAENDGVQRGFDDHPLRLHFGVDPIGRPIFFLRTADVPPNIELSDVVEVEVRERPAFDEWMLLLTLRDLSYQNTFMDLCLDLAGRAGSEPTEDAALKEFFRTLGQFDDLFAKRRSLGLSQEELRGLVAELWFALRVAAPKTNHSEALQSWKGPFGAPQDFRLESGELFEVKAVHAQSSSVRISSADQLDPVGEDHMTHTVITLEECAPNNTSGMSLSDLIHEFEAGLDTTSNPRDGLEDRLKELQVLNTHRNYPQRFVVTGVRHFDVRDGFPRVVRASVPLGIDSLQYRLSLHAIAGFELTDPNIRLRSTAEDKDRTP